MLDIPGRLYPVDIVYTEEPQEDYIDAALYTVLQIHRELPNEDTPGDVLVFLPGQEEIENMVVLLKRHLVGEEEEEKRRTQGISYEEDGHELNDVVQNIQGIGANICSGNYHAIINGVMICSLFAALPPDQQVFAFLPKPEGCSRKIILATNIAETSVTIEGVRYVVDAGKVKTRNFSGVTGMESLLEIATSKAQATQRAGRAGRVSSGICFRLYPETAYISLREKTTPEILRVNLAQVVLQLKGMGIHDPRSFDFITAPSKESLVKAFELLFALDGIDKNMELTNHGKMMARLPLDPTFSNLLLQGPKYGCTLEILSAVSMLSSENVFYRPSGSAGTNLSLTLKAAAAHKRFASYEGDIPTLINVYQSWNEEAIYVPPSSGGLKAQKKRLKKLKSCSEIRSKASRKRLMVHGEWCQRNFISGKSLVRARDVRNQLLDICSRDTSRGGMGWDVSVSCGEEMELFLKCICGGLFLQAASRIKIQVDAKKIQKQATKLRNGRYKTNIGGKEVFVHPTSTMFGRNPAPKCVVYTELLVTKKTYIRGVTQVKEEWLKEVAPQFFK